jgi:hypothetical protein
MTAQFHEGQEVEVEVCATQWFKAKIVQLRHGRFLVEFPDGTRDVFSGAHIRLSMRQVEQELIKNGERFLDAMGDEVKP